MKRLNKFWRGKLFIVIGITLISCAPNKVPSDASHEWDFISGSIWYWSDKLESGCTAWMASERWISVQLVTNSDCSAGIRHDRLRGERVSYADYADVLVFQEYGPWSLDIRDALSLFDNDGAFLGFKPCPHEITIEDISRMKSLSTEAWAIATTDEEKKVMERISVRLENVDLSALSSEQFGCTDAPLKNLNK